MVERIFTQTFGVVAALIEKDGKFLLVKETKEMAKNQWNHPAGWIDLEENPMDAIFREVKEETGYDFQPTHILGIYSLLNTRLVEKFGIVFHPIKIIFLGRISENQEKFMEDEIAEVKWFTPEEIENMDVDTLRDLDIKQMVKDYFAGKKYPLEILTHTTQE